MSLARRMDVLECRRGSAAMDALVQRSFMILRARAEVDAYRRCSAARSRSIRGPSRAFRRPTTSSMNRR